MTSLHRSVSTAQINQEEKNNSRVAKLEQFLLERRGARQPVDDLEEFERELHGMIERHAALTGSPRAKEILSDWPRWKDLFLKVLPMEYRMILGQMTREDAETKREEKAKE